MRKIFENSILILQIPILYFSYYFFFLFKAFIQKKKFVIGTDEIGKNIYDIGSALNDSTTVCLRKNKQHDLKYDFSINIDNRFLRFFEKPSGRS